jgi:hypothetical protein
VLQPDSTFILRNIRNGGVCPRFDFKPVFAP